MSNKLPVHLEGFLQYLKDSHEKANEDLVIAYFRKTFGERFTRQKQAKKSDGYVAGHFVLELKARTGDWYSGLLQGLAYQKLDLDFTLVIVAAKHFLAVWKIEDIPPEVRNLIQRKTGNPSSIGRAAAKECKEFKVQIRQKAIFDCERNLSDYFSDQPGLFQSSIRPIFDSFEKTLKSSEKVRQRITLRSFQDTLQRMVRYFDPEQPIKAVRAFYSMIYGWDKNAELVISHKFPNQATLGGETITDLALGQSLGFKEFVESHYVHYKKGESADDFFALYDIALDTVDKNFRIRHGIFFTDLHLSKFAMWLVKRKFEERGDDLGKNYLVIDPAAGSGNLVTNWRSPLELRHKVVSELEPELLFAVEQRMKGDRWHDGKFTVVPKVSENKGLNFLDCSAEDYLATLKTYLAEKGQKPDKPIAFLCNPPYRSDDDQSAGSIQYDVHPSIVDLIGKDASSERYNCFLAQMLRICEVAPDKGIPGQPVLLLFTKVSWLSKRTIFEKIRTRVLCDFEDVGGIIVNSKEFFDVKAKFPVAFTIWKHRGNNVKLDHTRSVPLLDLTWLKQSDLKTINWGAEDKSEIDFACNDLFANTKTIKINFGENPPKMKQWVDTMMVDFKRDRRVAERGQSPVGGLPLGDPRHNNKKAYGESSGEIIGFMDNLTPCRISKGASNRPWFRLNNQIMDCRKNRCYSGPPTHFGYSPLSAEDTEKMFLWFALGRCFAQCGYPMWADSLDLWAPTIPDDLRQNLIKLNYAIGFADNECVEVVFPANNPVAGAAESWVSNPLTPLDQNSYWNQHMATYFNTHTFGAADDLVGAVNNLFAVWDNYLSGRSEVFVPYSRPYFVGACVLRRASGLVQIKDYAFETNQLQLIEAWKMLQKKLKEAKSFLYEMLLDKKQLDYFSLSPTRHLEPVLEKRLALASILVSRLHDDHHFGRTKFSKLFYLADMEEKLELEADYYREAAGPLDPKLLYNEEKGIEILAERYNFFVTQKSTQSKFVRYLPDRNLPESTMRANDLFSQERLRGINRIVDIFQGLDTRQCEIVATLYACWNDLLLNCGDINDDIIVDEFIFHWHEKKKRFSRQRLGKALAWMRENEIVPMGTGRRTRVKPNVPLPA